MKRSTILVATAGALLFAASPADANRGPRALTFTARSELARVHLVDNAPSGDSVGDMVIFTERLFDRHGKLIGSDAASCVRLFDATSLCTGTYKLPRGRLMVQLLQPGLTGTRTYEQAITGGTGRYAGARGTVRVAQRASGGDRFRFRIRLG